MKIDAFQPASAPTLSLGRRGRSLVTASALAGIAYAAAWVVVLVWSACAVEVAWHNCDHPNRPDGRKRPRSSISPTIVTRHGKPWLALGAAGGSTIIGNVIGMLGKDFTRSLLRLVGMLLAALPLFAGFLLVLVDDRRRGLQDMVARTVVVYATEPPSAA